MIEKYLIKNELTLKRYRRFKRNRTAVVSAILLMIMMFFSFTAEFWANSRPIVMSYKGTLYFPLFKEYHPSLFERADIQVMDYRSLKLDADNSWAAWPIIQWDPYESNSAVESYPSPPTKANWFGTDDRGRDIFTRLLYGFRYTITFSVGVWLMTYIVGCTIGAAMGYLGGMTDLVGMRLIEIFESLPVLLILITLISIFNPNLFILILFSVIFNWTYITHYMRAQFLSLRKREYTEAARALGASHKRIILQHILPNGLSPIITLSPFTIAGNVAWLSVLDYLGLGLRPPTPSWGELLGQSQNYFSTADWLVWFPTGAVFLTMTLLINIALATRDAFDAKSSVG